MSKKHGGETLTARLIHGTWTKKVGCSVSSLTRCLLGPLHGTRPSTPATGYL